MRTGAGGAKAVREGFQEEVISASGVEGSRSVREGCPRVWGVTAGSMWLEPKRRRQEVVRAGVVESPGVSPCRALTAIITLDSTLRAVGNQDIFCGWNGVTGHPENVTAEGPKIDQYEHNKPKRQIDSISYLQENGLITRDRTAVTNQ